MYIASSVRLLYFVIGTMLLFFALGSFLWRLALGLVGIYFIYQGLKGHSAITSSFYQYRRW